MFCCELTGALTTMAAGYNECTKDMLHVRFLTRLTPSLLPGYMFSCHFVQKKQLINSVVSMLDRQCFAAIAFVMQNAAK